MQRLIQAPCETLPASHPPATQRAEQKRKSIFSPFSEKLQYKIKKGAHFFSFFFFFCAI